MPRTDEVCVANRPDPLVFVGCYNRFDNLAHAPRGTPASHSIRVYRFHRATGTMTLLTVNNTLENPAFFRYHPLRNVLYACTEDITKDNLVAAFAVSPVSGELTHMVSRSAMGKSTCYLTVDVPAKHMLFCNYWDSVIGTMPMTPAGMLEEVSVKLEPPKRVVARDISDHLANRQSEPHAHAIVLDPFFGRVAFVPDLGEDNIKQHLYDEATGTLTPTCTIACGPEGVGAHGPRYICFHPTLNTVYVINELSSTVSVFEFNATIAETLEAGSSKSTLRLVQSISTIPSAFPGTLNTCGRICIDPSGRYVLVSNRGHDSIAVFAINSDTDACGEGGKLSVVSFTHTRGRTPRHFQFDPTGTTLLAANQDTDTITLFSFDAATGVLGFSGHVYDCPSPNFVCVAESHVDIRRQEGVP
ncbi:Lactonase, 7-bladed beta-propeller-domain-containing protein [Tribonema minus]|uniref:Lactonase, 7-bladed beta-propeller-domain-containing protein n=1 Tax=Tribonema minus TaxID=303371 RepID=A0A835YI21_9STRA|nr:Lactonase, 7-bladed beta-propeller-domain-containing protein [Tribonema minus]